MRFKSLLAHAAAVAIFSCATIASAQTENLSSDILELDAAIAEARTEAGSFEGGLLLTMAELHVQTLELTRAILENRQAAEEGGATVEISVPAVQPDPARADELLAEIQAQQKVIAASEAEAAGQGGLLGSLVKTRVQTEKLVLSQLRMAWYQATYGISFPTIGNPSSQVAPDADPTPETTDATVTETAEVPEWADPKHPEIDYRAPIFQAYHDLGYKLFGWWAIDESKAEIDDSPKIVAVNLSQFDPDDFEPKALMAQCREGETAVIYRPGAFVIGNYSSNTLDVAVRIDDNAVQKQKWSELTSNKGAGLFGSRGEAAIRTLYDAEKVFLRLSERDGDTHDATFNMAGTPDAMDAVAGACGFSTLNLDRDDYRAVQGLLNAAGFSAGTPDGVWGNGSKTAMRAYQKANGLPETGAVDRATLEAMGLKGDN